ncbi:hypothetical protein Y032_0141g2259 [Ancylostoma ceylanicum]|uniref:Uncharacterized protein n=1 Tax=Ancylostoma ceylanicum TaxID=53326 RepID=A0A016T413_9BILA|nr:hypothetical protein Y032_0141g2259 [Ancylostoma ceylanicum]
MDFLFQGDDNRESNEKTAPRSDEAFKSQELLRRKVSSVENFDSHEGGKGPRGGPSTTARKFKEDKRKSKEKPSVVKVNRPRSKAEPMNPVIKKQQKAPAPNQVKAIGIAMDEDLEDGTYEDVNILR